ncbi:MAG: glycosyltransferase family 4 protein [Candidatus Thermoplasmatota archaeon]
MESLRLAVNTQTPLLRFRDVSGTEYKFTTGGVTRMLLPLLKQWLADGTVADAEWVALAADDEARPVIEFEGVRLSFVALPEPEKSQYVIAKERMWELLNSGPGVPPPEGKISEDAWIGYDAYQARCAEAMREACERVGSPDLLYVHDFQQLGVAGAWRGRERVPAVFQLHTPYPSSLPREWDDHFVAGMSKYDAVVVSTRRYADNLRNAGLKTPIHVIRPFVDPRDSPPASSTQLERFRSQFHLRDADRVILNVGRMDPVKGQDHLIMALPAVLREVPDAHLVLVGNGSFSSSKTGGLGLSKGEQWRAAMEALARDLRVDARVTFTGHLGDEMLPAAYEASHVFCLPSTREGFGLAAIEAWLHARPVVVSDRAGVAELVQEGEDGLTLDCGDTEALAAALVVLLRDPDGARAMGRAGERTAAQATLPSGRLALERVFEEVLASGTAEVRTHA